MRKRVVRRKIREWRKRIVAERWLIRTLRTADKGNTTVHVHLYLKLYKYVYVSTSVSIQNVLPPPS